MLDGTFIFLTPLKKSLTLANVINPLRNSTLKLLQINHIHDKLIGEQCVIKSLYILLKSH